MEIADCFHGVNSALIRLAISCRGVGPLDPHVHMNPPQKKKKIYIYTVYIYIYACFCRMFFPFSKVDAFFGGCFVGLLIVCRTVDPTRIWMDFFLVLSSDQDGPLMAGF